MIQLLGSFCGQPASAMKPGTLAVDGTPYTPDRSARRSRMPVAASALLSGFGAWASLSAVENIDSSAPQTASSFRFILTPSLEIGRQAFSRNLYRLTGAVKAETETTGSLYCAVDRSDVTFLHRVLTDTRWLAAKTVSRPNLCSGKGADVGRRVVVTLRFPVPALRCRFEKLDLKTWRGFMF